MAKIVKLKLKDGTLSKKWYTDFTADGRRIKRALSEYKPQATRMLAEMLELRRSRRRGLIPQRISWDFFKQDFLRKSRVNDTMGTFYHNRRAFELVDAVSKLNDLAQMTPDRLLEIHTRLKEKKFPPTTIERSVRAIVTAMRRAEDLKYVQPQNWRIIKTVQPMNRKDFYEFQNYVELLNRLQGDWQTSAWLMGRAGLRVGEVLHLEWQDIQFKNHRIIFRSKPEYGWHIKGDRKTLTKIRSIPMAQDLQRYLESIRKPQGFVLGPECSRTREVYGKQLTRALVATKVRTYLGKLGFPYVLRHTFGSHLAQSGVNDQTIAELMGWTTTKMVKIYSHLRPVDLQAGIARLPEVCTSVRLLQEGPKKACTTFVPVQDSILPSNALIGSLDPQNGAQDLSS